MATIDWAISRNRLHKYLLVMLGQPLEIRHSIFMLQLSQTLYFFHLFLCVCDGSFGSVCAVCRIYQSLQFTVVLVRKPFHETMLLASQTAIVWFAVMFNQEVSTVIKTFVDVFLVARTFCGSVHDTSILQ